MPNEKIVSLEFLGEQESIDLEIDHACHNFIANDIVVSNSHAAAYASLTAVTAWLKANHALEFFLALLQISIEESKQQEVIGKIFSEMRKQGLDLLPPHLTKSDVDFKIESPDTIRYGLSSIKGMGDKAKEAIKKIQVLKTPTMNLFEFFIVAKESGMDIGTLSAMIQAGAYEEPALKRSNSRLVLDAQLWNLLNPKEKAESLNIGSQFNFDMVEILKHKRDTVPADAKRTTPFAGKRIETLRKNALKYISVYKVNSTNENLANYYYQSLLLGFSYGQTLNGIFRKNYPGLISIDEINQMRYGTRVKFVGQVKKVINSTGKKIREDGKRTKYQKIFITDSADSIEVLLFNEQIGLAQARNLGEFKENDIVFIEGMKKEDAVFANNITIQGTKIYTRLASYTKDVKEGKLDAPVEDAVV